MKEQNKGVLLFYPYVSKKSAGNIKEKLAGRWLGQGPSVDKFENDFRKKFCKNQAVVATGSGTDSLHLAYLLAGIKKGDEVITTVFTCTATNIPLLYIEAKIKFAAIWRLPLKEYISEIKPHRTEPVVSKLGIK